MKPESSGRRRRRKLASIAALALPLALFLSGCQLNSQFTVMTDGAIALDIEFHDESGTLTNAGLNCESFAVDREVFPGELQGEALEKTTSRDLACRIHGYSENPVGSGMLQDNGSTYTLTLDSKMVEALKGLPETAIDHMRMQLVARMPGKIVEATPGGDIKGNEVVYTDPSIWLSGPIVVEGEKGDGIGIMGWVIGGLAVALGAGFVISRFVGRKDGEMDDADPDDAMVVRSDHFDSKIDDEQARLEEHVAHLAPAKTTESAVNMGALPPVGSDIEDSESADYSEEIGMVDPQLQGAGADAVQRKNVMPPIPAADTQTSPIPGMPPRTPLPDELYAEFGVSSSEEKVPAIPSIPNLPPLPEGLAQPPVAESAPAAEAESGGSVEADAAVPDRDAAGDGADGTGGADAGSSAASAAGHASADPFGLAPVADAVPFAAPLAEEAAEGEAKPSFELPAEAELSQAESEAAQVLEVGIGLSTDEAGAEGEAKPGFELPAEAELSQAESEAAQVLEVGMALATDEAGAHGEAGAEEAAPAEEVAVESEPGDEPGFEPGDWSGDEPGNAFGDGSEGFEPAAEPGNVDEADAGEEPDSYDEPEPVVEGERAEEEPAAGEDEDDSPAPGDVPGFLTNPDDLPDFQTGIPPVFGPR